MTPDASWEFQRAGWDRAAAYYDEYWTDTRLFVEAMAEGVARYADGDGFTLPIVARVVSVQPRG